MATKRNGSTRFSRRRFLQGSAALGAGATLGGLAPARWARADAPTLNMWWWGEQELPGLQAFVADSVKNYSAATVKTMLQDTAVVISQFQTAAAAHKAPDIQYLWNGTCSRRRSRQCSATMTARSTGWAGTRCR
jgi:ABC-type glycerol-3-phosphate transport system substrate-binding protein